MVGTETPNKALEIAQRMICNNCISKNLQKERVLGDRCTYNGSKYALCPYAIAEAKEIPEEVTQEPHKETVTVDETAGLTVRELKNLGVKKAIEDVCRNCIKTGEIEELIDSQGHCLNRQSAHMLDKCPYVEQYFQE